MINVEKMAPSHPVRSADTSSNREGRPVGKYTKSSPGAVSAGGSSEGGQ